MEEVKEVKLYGTWASTYCVMIQIALKLKGVPYEYIEEDLQNKSEMLISLNPVHKKVPVLVVDGKPIAESIVILEYIDEMWKGSPLLPEHDPYKRAMVRFWADFIYQKTIPCSYDIMRTAGEAQEKAIKEFIDYQNTLENGIKKELVAASEGPFIHGDSPGLLDLIIGSSAPGFRVLTDLAGKELLEKERLPVLHSCMSSFPDLAVAKETLAPYEKLLPRVLAMREKALAAAQS